MTCPDADTLATIASLDDEQRAAIVDHAASCDSCRAIVVDLLERPTALAATMDPATALRSPGEGGDPTEIDRYRIERRIGAGAMGVVFAAYDPELARPVAIKLLRSGGSAERMRREAQALAKLTHPNVVAVFDVGEHDGAAFVAMALVDGENLRSWLRGERTTEQRIDAIVQAARGVDAAHRRGIIHRDLKPDNIFVAHTGEVLVGDFGLASTRGQPNATVDRLTETSDLTVTGSVVGTPAYMAPEQLDGEASAASDQFALCVTAWEALYGERPFSGKSVAELATAANAGPPIEPEGRKVPAYVRVAIRRGLAADPAARHASMSDLLAALTPRRKRWPYVVAGALGLASIVGIAAFAWTGDPEADAIAACDALSGPSAWTAANRASVVARLSGAKPVLASSIIRIGDRYAAEWTALRRTSCVANARRELSDPVVAATVLCLERRAATFAWALDTKSSGHPFDTLGYLEVLEPIETCRGTTPRTPPSEELRALQAVLDQQSVLMQIAPERVVDLDALVARADKLADPGTTAEAHYLAATMLLVHGRDIEDEILRAIASAEQAGDDRIRTRASALRATVAARAGRFTEARGHRDLATSALARTSDPKSTIAVERASVALAFSQNPKDELAAYQRIAAIQIAQLGEPSRSLSDTYFSIGGAMLKAGDPTWRSTVDRAVAMLALLSDDSPLAAVDNAGLRERAPAQRIALSEQAVAVARQTQPDQVAAMLTTLGYDYELIGDFERALAVALEALQLVPAEDVSVRVEVLENAASSAFEVADATDDKALRAKRLDQALSLLDQLPAPGQELDTVQALRGRALVLIGRYADAVPLLNSALVTAERAEPAAPYRVAMRAFALAQALWESGGERERDRARALAAQAAARFPEARTMFEANAEAYGVGLDRLEHNVVRLEAWRKNHR